MKLTQDHLAAVLADHKLWLAGKGGSRANLSDADLSRASLTCATLTRADLAGADLSRAGLAYADLTGATLTRATLNGANLTGATLTRADLTGANLNGATLNGATHILRLPVSDPQGSGWIAVKGARGWRIFADGRAFTLKKARAHWLAPSYAGPAEVKSTVGFALDWLEKIAAAETNQKQEGGQ